MTTDIRNEIRELGEWITAHFERVSQPMTPDQTRALSRLSTLHSVANEVIGRRGGTGYVRWWNRTDNGCAEGLFVWQCFGLELARVSTRFRIEWTTLPDPDPTPPSVVWWSDMTFNDPVGVTLAVALQSAARVYAFARSLSAPRSP